MNRVRFGLLVLLAAAAGLTALSQEAGATDYWTIGVPSSSTAIGPPQATTNVDVTYYGPAATPGPMVNMYKDATFPAPVMAMPVDSGTTGVFHFDDQLQGSQISDSAVYFIRTPTPDYEVFQIGPIAVGTSSVEATRLIPENEFATWYRVGSWKDAGNSFVCYSVCVNYSQDMPFFTVVSIKDNTQVTVVTTCKNAPSVAPAGAPGHVDSMTPGTAYNYVVNRGQALHIESPSLQNAYTVGGLVACDLSGSTVSCTTPCGVWAGNNCMRAQDTTCDLAYAQMLPDPTVGSLYVVCAALPSGTGQLDALMIRSVSGPTNVYFDAPVGTAPAGPFTIGLAPVSDSVWSLFYFKADSVIKSDAPIHLLQLMAQSTLPVPVLGILIPGANLVVTSQPARGWGDPAQMQVRPLDKGTFDHWLYAPESFKDYLYVGHPLTAILELDGAPLMGTRAIGTTGYGCTTTVLDGQDSNTGNTHHLVDLTGGSISGQMVGLGLSALFMYDTGSPPPIVPPPQPPVASFKAVEVNTGCGPHPIAFTDGSTAGDDPLVGWFWEFGDGTTSTDQNPTHTYPAPGTYYVTLVVTDEKGFQATYSQYVTAVVGDPCLYPTIPEDNGATPRPPHDGVDPAVADSDTDKDGTPNALDNCVFTANADQSDIDADGAGDLCDTDMDDDTILNAGDNCLEIPNTAQADLNGDGEGDVCDDDVDGDGVLNTPDNCATAANADQADVDGDGIGDLCEAHRFVAPAGNPGTRDVTAVGAAPVQTAAAGNPWLVIGITAIVAAVLLVVLIAIVARRRP